MSRQSVILSTFILLIVGLLCLVLPGHGVRAYLCSHATLWSYVSSPDGRFAVAIYRYPELHDIPEIFGFGQGFVRLLEVRSGMVLAQRNAEDLAQVNTFRWSVDQVVIQGLGKLELPQ